MIIPSRTGRNAGWWVIATAIFYQAYVLGIFLYCFTFWIEGWSKEFSVPASEVMLAVTFANISAACVAVFLGRILDKTEVVRVVALGIILFALGMWIISLASALWQILLVYAVLFGIAIVSVGPLSGQLLAVRWFSRRRSIAIGWVSIGSSMGGLLCPPLITLMVADMGWRETHQVLAIVCLLVILPMALLMVREPARMQPAQADGELPLSEVPAATLPSRHRPYREIFSESKFWLILLTLAPFICAVYIYVVNLAPFGNDLGISTGQTALVMSVMSLCMIVGKIGCGILFDSWRLRTVLMQLLLMLGVALLILAASPPYWMLLACSALFGVSAGAYLTISGALVNQMYAESEFGTIMGLVLMSNIWVYLAVPLSAGVREHSGSYSIIWLALTALTLLGAVAAHSISAEPA